MVNLKQPETVEECLTLQSHFVGIPRITKKNHKEFYRRGKTLQALGLGFLKEGRMPSLQEVHDHIDLSTDAPSLEPKKWKNVLYSILDDMTNRVIETEEEEKDKESDGDVSSDTSTDN